MATPTRRSSAVRFFFKHAGWSYDHKTETSIGGRWRCARLLAAAEKEAQARGWTYIWVDDSASRETLSCDCGCEPPDEMLGCVLRTAHDKHAASLWGIGDPTPEYRRVVEAELAAEHLHEIRESVKEAI